MYILSGYICSMKKKKNSKKKFERLEDPWWNPDEEPMEEESEEVQLPMVNETMIQAFVNEWQPEDDERITDVHAFDVGELRERMQIYRTFDSKAPDPLPFYISRLEAHGFRMRMGFGGEQVILARRRNNGQGMELRTCDNTIS